MLPTKALVCAALMSAIAPAFAARSASAPERAASASPRPDPTGPRLQPTPVLSAAKAAGPGVDAAGVAPATLASPTPTPAARALPKPAADAASAAAPTPAPASAAVQVRPQLLLSGVLLRPGEPPRALLDGAVRSLGVGQSLPERIGAVIEAIDATGVTVREAGRAVRRPIGSDLLSPHDPATTPSGAGARNPFVPPPSR